MAGTTLSLSDIGNAELIKIDTLMAMLEDAEDRVRHYNQTERRVRFAEEDGTANVKLLDYPMDHFRKSILEIKSSMLEVLRMPIQNIDSDIVRAHMGVINENLDNSIEHLGQVLQLMLMLQVGIETLEKEHARLTQDRLKKTATKASQSPQERLSDKAEEPKEEDKEEA
ncbi:hypothetical protein Daesc_009062 [Daldinia eschscholtzii]|uniref:Uncharacterized protein n=1 Tax=Daldinia eschscholtzii TaxID=292717 RepID=A0AAX6M8L0_9PEZI